MVGRARLLPAGEVLAPLPVVASVTGLQGSRLLYLLPGVEPGGCHRLFAHCRRLQAVWPDGPVPGAAEPAWVEVEGAGPLPLPAVARPAGQPLDVWLQGRAAGAADLLALLAAVVQGVDRLAAHGYQPDSLGLSEVWVAEGRLSWLPAALRWPRVADVPTAATLRAAGHCLGRFLRELLTAARAVPGMTPVWEESWALCHGLLEHGYGVSPAGLLAELAALSRRSRGEAAAAHPALNRFVVVDAVGVRRALRGLRLDLVGLLRQLIGPDALYTGVLVHDGRDAWSEQAAAARLRPVAAEAPDLRQLGEEAGAAAVLLVCGRASDLLAELPFMRAGRGVCVPLAPEPPPAAPERWEWRSPPAGLDRWCRIG